MKKILSIILIFTMLFSSIGGSFAMETSSDYTNYEIQLIDSSEYKTLDGSTFTSETVQIGNQKNKKKNSVITIEKLKKTNGDVYGTLIEGDKVTEAYYDESNKKLYIDGMLREDLSPKQVKGTAEEFLLNEQLELSNMTRASFYPGEPIGNHPYQSNGVVQNNVPVGETVAFAAFVISILVGWPVSKLGQIIFLAIGTTVGGIDILNETLLYRSYQYRTVDKITDGTAFPQYAYKNKVYLYATTYSNKFKGPMDSGWWFASRPY